MQSVINYDVRNSIEQNKPRDLRWVSGEKERSISMLERPYPSQGECMDFICIHTTVKQCFEAIGNKSLQILDDF